MNKFTTKTLALATLAGIAGSANAQQTFNFPGVVNSVDDAGGFHNAVFPGINAVSAAYAVNNNITLNSGLMTRITSGTFAREAQLLLKNSAFPTDSITLQPSLTTDYITINLVAGTQINVTGTLISKTVPIGSTWTVEFFESAQDGPADIAESTYTGLNFSTQPFVSGDIVLNDAGPIESRDAVGTAGNQIRIVPGLGSMATLTSQAISLGATWTQTQFSTTPVQAKVRLSHSALPGLWMDYTVNNSTATTSPVSTGYAQLAAGIGGGLESAIIPAGGNFRFEFYESIQNGGVGLPEATWSNFNLQVYKSATPPPISVQTLTVPPATNFIDFVRDPDNSRVAIGATASTFVMGSTLISTGQIQRNVATALATTCKIRLRNSAYPFHWLDFIPANLGFAGAPSLSSFSAIRTVGNFSGLTLGGLTIPAGSTWTAEPYYDLSINNDGIAEATINSLVIRLIAGTPFTPGTAPAATINLGIVGGPITNVAIPAIPATTVQWFKFNILSAVDQGTGGYIDIFFDVNPATPNTDEDSEIGLYTADGRFAGSDDFAGEGAMSQLSYGAGTRPATDSGTLANGDAFSGQDGEGLVAGTYYIALGAFNMTFGATAFSVSAALSAGNPDGLPAGYRLKIRSSLPVPPTQVITGTVDLLDWTISEAGRVCAWTLLNSSSTIVASGNTTLGTGGAYSLSANVPNGSYTLTMKSSHWLKKASAATAMAGTASIAFSLINGDVNNANFVGFDDFDILSASFNLSLGDAGYQTGADLNGDDFVGFDDFDILSANFNSAGD